MSFVLTLTWRNPMLSSLGRRPPRITGYLASKLVTNSQGIPLSWKFGNERQKLVTRNISGYDCFKCIQLYPLRLKFMQFSENIKGNSKYLNQLYDCPLHHEPSDVKSKSVTSLLWIFSTLWPLCILCSNCSSSGNCHEHFSSQNSLCDNLVLDFDPVLKYCPTTGEWSFIHV